MASNYILKSLTTGYHQQIIVRLKHSNRQIKRLFKRNPAKLRIEARLGIEKPKPKPLPIRQFPAIFNARFLPNGWSAPPKENLAEYPFDVTRTRNKPGSTAGFLPVYSKFRNNGTKATTLIKRTSGDQDLFLSELRAILEIPEPNNPKEDKIQIRTGGTIEVDGNRVREVKGWLAGLGF